MVFVFYSMRTSRNISCFSPWFKHPVATYSKKAAQAVKTLPLPSSPRSSNTTLSANSLRSRVIGVQTVRLPDLEKPVHHDDRDESKTGDGKVVGTEKQAAKKKEEEWRYMEIELDKLKHHCLMLSKIRLTSLVVATTMAGYVLAPAPFHAYTFVVCSVGTGLVSATANAINQFFEVPFDAQMSRTKNRVLVRGYLTPAHAITFATISGICGLSLLYSEVNGLTAALGAVNLALYTLIYTPMKRISILNTWIGSIVGAIPPLMGWAACVGDITAPGAWIMSGLLYAWQFPHFNALSWNLRPDYSRAGYRMMAVTDPNLCRKTALRYTGVLTGLCYLAPALGVTTWWFALESTPLNAYFLYLAYNFYRHSDSGNSRKLFHFSLIHLPALMLLLLVNKKYWFSEETKSNTLINEDNRNVLSTFSSKLIALVPTTV